MEFLLWHYTTGLAQYTQRWIYSLGWVIHYFSLTRLLPSLFSPWKRLINSDDIVGFNLEASFRQLSFNLISRFIGAIVRFTLFISGTLLLLPLIVVGLIGMLAWLGLPFIGLPYFLLKDAGQKRLLGHLITSLKADPARALQTLLDSRPGRFLLSHTGIVAQDLINESHSAPLKFEGFSPNTFAQIVTFFIDSGVWEKGKLRQKGLNFEDLSAAARWWDDKNHVRDDSDHKVHYSRPGIGLELLFGYTPTLNQYSTDLSLPQTFSHRLIGRAELVSRVERILSSGNSVVLTGLPGVGKKTIVLEFARRAMSGELGPKMAYKRVLELDYNFLLSQSFDLNQKKSSLSLILKEASLAGNVILVIKDLHRLTHQEVEGLDFTDLLEKFLEDRKLMIIAISSHVDYERFLSTNSRLRKFLEPIDAPQVSKDDALEILMDFATNLENTRHITTLVTSLRAIITGSDKYITDTPFPEKALEILDNVTSYVDKQDKRIITPDDVNAVISESTGISLARLTQKEREILADLEGYLHNRLVGQESAVSAVAKSLRARSVGGKSENRPLGSFLFLGPTGVGKTEMAKTLCQVYFGSTESLLRFDMAEYAGDEGLTRLIGSVNKNLPGRLSSEIKSHPASLLLLDEIEKSPPEISNLFLSLLDEGQITDAFGQKINCKHLFVIATSNAGAEYIRQLVNNNVSPDQMQKQVLDYVQKQGIFSSEFLNRFDGVIVFEPLQKAQLAVIAQLMLGELAKNLDQQDITLVITPDLCGKLAEDGFEPEFGARPMRRLVDITLGDVIGKAILKGEVEAGDKIKIIPHESGEYSLVKV